MMNEVNPCETCKKNCGYKLFIDCPIWLEWAARMNELQAEQEDHCYGR